MFPNIPRLGSLMDLSLEQSYYWYNSNPLGDWNRTTKKNPGTSKCFKVFDQRNHQLYSLWWVPSRQISCQPDGCRASGCGEAASGQVQSRERKALGSPQPSLKLSALVEEPLCPCVGQRESTGTRSSQQACLTLPGTGTGRAQVPLLPTGPQQASSCLRYEECAWSVCVIWRVFWDTGDVRYYMSYRWATQWSSF